MAAYSSILAWGIPWIEESGGLQPMGPQRVDLRPVQSVMTTSTKTTTKKNAKASCFQLSVGLDGGLGGTVFIKCLQRAWESEGIPTASACCTLCRI